MEELAKLYYEFWNQLLPAYMEEHIPENASLPYLTYTFKMDRFGNESVQQVKIWTRSKSFQSLSRYCASFGDLVPDSGTVLHLNNKKGAIYIYRGAPFIQILPLDNPDLKVAYINVIIKSFIY